MLRTSMLIVAIVTTSIVEAQVQKKAVNPKPVYSEPHDFKGIRLGISLAEFRAAPVPDDREYEEQECTYRGFSTPGTGVVCEKYKVRPEPECDTPTADGVIACQWVYKERNYKNQRGKTHYPSIAGRTVDHYSLEFIARPDDVEPKLFRMEFRYKGSLNAIADRYEIVGAALAERFGNPTAREEIPVRNAFGAVFEKGIRVWANKHSKVALIRFDGSLEWLTLRYFVPEYVDYHSERMVEEEKRRGPKL